MNDALPAWLGALREDASLSGELGIRWLEPDVRAALHASVTSSLEGMSGDERWKQRGLERFARSVPLGLGPERNKRVMRHACSTALFFDPERPSHVCLSLAASMSPLTWAEAPATPEGLRELFARYFVTDPVKVAALPRRVRTLVNFGQIEREQLEEALTSAGYPMLDDAVWYSAHAEDPWLGLGELWGLSLMAHMRDVRREDDRRYRSFSVRTLFSRSVVKIEQHPFGLWVMEIRYAPVDDGAGVRWVNEIFGSRFPEDVPADVIGSTILQGGHTHAGEIEEQEARGDIDKFGIVARLALAPGEPATTTWLRSMIEHFSDDEGMLGFIADAGARYEDFEALFEVAARTAGTELSEGLLARMMPSEPVAPAEEGDDDGEDDDDDDDDEEEA